MILDGIDVEHCYVSERSLMKSSIPRQRKYCCRMPNQGLLYVLNDRFKFHRIFDVRALCKAISLIPPVVIPPVHIAVLYHFWRSYNFKVDRKRCECSCWDTVFKGPYETHIGSFKHLYFNATVNTLKIWITTVVGIIVLYETVKYLIRLGLKNQLRYSMLTLFISSMFSHYYTWYFAAAFLLPQPPESSKDLKALQLAETPISGTPSKNGSDRHLTKYFLNVLDKNVCADVRKWNYINYWNDEYYKQWNHQLYFTTTELFSTYLVLKLADKQETFTRKKSLFILGISLIHIVAGCVDQFIHNVLRLSGRPHQVVRDLAFMFGDVLHLIISLVFLSKSWNIKRVGLLKDLILTSTTVLLGLLVYAHL